jgi:hypothetical protein
LRETNLNPEVSAAIESAQETQISLKTFSVCFLLDCHHHHHISVYKGQPSTQQLDHKLLSTSRNQQINFFTISNMSRRTRANETQAQADWLYETFASASTAEPAPATSTDPIPPAAYPTAPALPVPAIVVQEPAQMATDVTERPATKSRGNRVQQAPSNNTLQIF